MVREVTTTTSKIAFIVLVVVNFIAMLVSSVLFSIGVWSVASAHTLSNVIQKYGHHMIKALITAEVLTLHFGIILAMVAIFIFFISFMGFYGAIVRSTFLLFMYSLLTLLLLLLECALFYYFTTDFKQKGLQEGDGQWTHGLRLLFKCCEYNHTIPASFLARDRLPWSCCGWDEHKANNCTIENIHNKNCHQTISSWLHKYEMALYTSLAVIHIILSSCSLLRRSRSSTSLSYS